MWKKIKNKFILDKKIFRQIFFNIFIMLFSLLIIYIAKCVQNDSCVDIKEIYDSDFIFVLITSLITIVGQRYIENIKVSFYYWTFLVAEVLIMMYLYGLSIVKDSGFIKDVGQYLLFIFGITYTIEVILILSGNKKIKNSNNKQGGFGYNAYKKYRGV